MGSVSQKVIFAALTIGIAIIIYGLNHFTPMASDDWNYVFIVGTNDYIHNLWDVVKSQYNHYFLMNGRVTAQSLAQITDSFLSRGAFSVVNTLVFILFLHAITINVTSEHHKLYHKIFPAAFVLIFLLIPEFNMDFLWLSGACNYLWVATLLLLFHYLLEKRNSTGIATLTMLFLYGIVCGWSNEAFVVGMAGAYFIYYAIHWKSLTRHKMVMLAGFYIGALFLVLSPSSIQRASTDMVAHNTQQYLQLLLSMDNLRLMYLAIIFIPVLAIFKQIKFGAFLKQELWLVITIIISFLFVLATNHQSGHSRMGIELFSLILLFRAIPWNRIGYASIAIATVAALVVGTFAIKASQACAQANEDEFAQIQRHEYPIKTRLPHHAPFLKRYIVPYSYNVMGDGFKTYGTDEFMSKYFHYDKIYFLPEDFVNATQEKPMLFDTFQTDVLWPFYAKREDKEKDRGMRYAMVDYRPYDYSRLGWPLRLIAPKLASYYLNQIPVKIKRVTINDVTFILAEKNPDMDFRFKGITLMK